MTSAQGKRVKKWVKALRSGQYRQTRGQLRKVGYCCLGVACQVYHEETGKGEWTKNGGVGGDPLTWTFRIDDESNAGHLPSVVRDYFGITTTIASYTGRSGPSSLASRNDGGANLQKIADIIESKPRGLFK